jgi:hypothetical protein
MPVVVNRQSGRATSPRNGFEIAFVGPELYSVQANDGEQAYRVA